MRVCNAYKRAPDFYFVIYFDSVLMKQRGDVWWVNFDPSVGQEVKFLNKAGTLTQDELAEVERIIRLQLDLR